MKLRGRVPNSPPKLGREFLLLLLLACLFAPNSFAQARGQTPPPTARAAAPVDFTGYWVSVVTEDWRWRMVTPARGDFAGVPLNAEGRRVARQALCAGLDGCISPGWMTIP